MTDLKLIDELLCDIKQTNNLTWLQMEHHTSVTNEAMNRLRSAYRSGEARLITLGLALYFRATHHASF